MVVARPAIILTGDSSSSSFNSYSRKPDTGVQGGPSVRTSSADSDESEATPPPIRADRERMESRESRHFYSKDDIKHQDYTPSPRRSRYTGPIQAPPGLFRPDDSTSVPDDIISLEDVDTKVDDIILDFLRMESQDPNDE
mgnify:CR=1 FL=1